MGPGLHQRPWNVQMAAMRDHPILDRDRQKLPEPMTDEDLEDFLTEAIGLYAEQTKTPVARIQTFEEGGLLLKNRGLVIGIGGREFRISIVKTALSAGSNDAAACTTPEPAQGPTKKGRRRATPTEENSMRLLALSLLSAFAGTVTAQGSWSPTSPLPEPRRSSAVAACGARIYRST